MDNTAVHEKNEKMDVSFVHTFFSSGFWLWCCLHVIPVLEGVLKLTFNITLFIHVYNI